MARSHRLGSVEIYGQFYLPADEVGNACLEIALADVSSDGAPSATIDLLVHAVMDGHLWMCQPKPTYDQLLRR